MVELPLLDVTPLADQRVALGTVAHPDTGEHHYVVFRDKVAATIVARHDEGRPLTVTTDLSNLIPVVVSEPCPLCDAPDQLERDTVMATLSFTTCTACHQPISSSSAPPELAANLGSIIDALSEASGIDLITGESLTNDDED